MISLGQLRSGKGFDALWRVAIAGALALALTACEGDEGDPSAGPEVGPDTSAPDAGGDAQPEPDANEADSSDPGPGPTVDSPCGTITHTVGMDYTFEFTGDLQNWTYIAGGPSACLIHPVLKNFTGSWQDLSDPVDALQYTISAATAEVGVTVDAGLGHNPVGETPNGKWQATAKLTVVESTDEAFALCIHDISQWTGVGALEGKTATQAGPVGISCAKQPGSL